MKTLTYIVVFIFLGLNLKAQSDCKKKISQAEDYFVTAQYTSCIETLNSSLLNCYYSKREKELIYKLLIKAYLEIDNTVESNNYAKKLLENNPSYELNESENSEDYERLIKKFSVHPLFSFGLRNTLLRPSFTNNKTYSILLNEVDYNTKYEIDSKTMLVNYAWLELQLYKKIAINVEFALLNINYKRNFSKTDWIMKYSEKMSFLETPIYIKKYLFNSKIIFPFIYLGASHLGLIKAKSNLQIDYVNESYITNEKINFSSNVSNIDMLPMRNRSNLLGLIGAGVGFRFKNFGFNIDARYYKGFKSLIKTSKRFYNEILINDYFYIDNSVLLNKFEAGITISYTLKNSVKKL